MEHTEQCQNEPTAPGLSPPIASMGENSDRLLLSIFAAAASMQELEMKKFCKELLAEA